MVKIKEIKISIHRKYTKGFQSYGYRIGIMMDVGKTDPRQGFYEGKVFLNERIAEEDLIIQNIMDKKIVVKQNLSMLEVGTEVLELVEIPKNVKEVDERSFGKGDVDVKESCERVVVDVKELVGTTEKALMVLLFDGRRLWIPKSCVKDGGKIDNWEKGVKTMLIVDKWFAEKVGMLLWKNNVECPQCGKEASQLIRAVETGYSYCSSKCASEHVNETYTEL